MPIEGKRQTKDIIASEWDEVIADAKRKHAEGLRYVAKLRRAIKIIEKKIASGESCPPQLQKL